MKDEPHIEAAKYLCKVRLSLLLSNVEERRIQDTLKGLVRLVLELQQATGQQLLEAE